MQQCLPLYGLLHESQLWRKGKRVCSNPGLKEVATLWVNIWIFHPTPWPSGCSVDRWGQGVFSMTEMKWRCQPKPLSLSPGVGVRLDLFLEMQWASKLASRLWECEHACNDYRGQKHILTWIRIGALNVRQEDCAIKYHIQSMKYRGLW